MLPSKNGARWEWEKCKKKVFQCHANRFLSTTSWCARGLHKLFDFGRLLLSYLLANTSNDGFLFKTRAAFSVKFVFNGFGIRLVEAILIHFSCTKLGLCMCANGILGVFIQENGMEYFWVVPVIIMCKWFSACEQRRIYEPIMGDMKSSETSNCDWFIGKHSRDQTNITLT